MEAFCDGDLAGAQDCLDGGGGEVSEFMHGVEARKMQRDIGTEVVAYPAGQLADLVLAVVLAGDEQVDDFEPDAGFTDDLHGLKDGVAGASGEIGIKRRGEALEVDFIGIDMGQESTKGF